MVEENQALGDPRLRGVHRSSPVPMPRLPLQDFMALRRLKEKRSLNDLVEDFFRLLIEEEEFFQYLDAIHDEQAIEGSCSADNLKAAEMIRDRAREMESELALYKLATIAKSLNVVVKRYGLSRKERRYTVGGEYVPPDGANHTSE